MSEINNKIDFYRKISEKTGFEQKDVKTFYEGLLEVIHDTVEKQDETFIHFPDLGRLNIKVDPAHMGINPKTQERLLVKTARRAHFKFFPKFTKQININNRYN